MGFADDQFDKYLRKNLTLLDDVKVDELLNYLSRCLSKSSVERLNAYVRNQGNRKSVIDLYLTLSGSDNWARHFIDALRHCEHNVLAETLEAVYSSYQLPGKRSSPQSPSSSWNSYKNQSPQENPQRYSSLPGHMSPTTPPAPLPKPSQRVNQIQPKQEMIQSPPSEQNHEFRSLPPYIQDPPALPRTPLSHNVSTAIQSDTRVLEDYSVSNPVPETTPYQPPEADVEDKSSISRNSLTGSDPLPSGSLSTRLKEPLPAVSIRPTSEDVSPEKDKSSITRNSHVGPDPLPSAKVSPSLKKPLPAVSIRPTFEDVSLAKDKSSISRNSHTGPDPIPSRSLSPSLMEKMPAVSIRPTSEEVSLAQAPESRTTPTYNPSTSSRGEADNLRGQPVRNKPANHPEQPVPASRAQSVRDTVLTKVQHNGQSAYPAVDDSPDRRSASVRPLSKEITEEEPNRGWPASQRVLPGSSCRPLSINDDPEEYLSKPGVLLSSGGVATSGEEESSLMLHVPQLEISCSDSGESSNASSSSPISQDPVPRVSTPNNQSMQTDIKRPEENDFMFDSKSSPEHSKQLHRSLSQEPEENSYVVQYSERPEVDLLGGNDDNLRNRPQKTPNTIESSHQDTPQKHSNKAEGRDYERTVLISVTVASLCLSLYLLWKSRHN